MEIDDFDPITYLEHFGSAWNRTEFGVIFCTGKPPIDMNALDP